MSGWVCRVMGGKAHLIINFSMQSHASETVPVIGYLDAYQTFNDRLKVFTSTTQQ